MSQLPFRSLLWVWPVGAAVSSTSRSGGWQAGTKAVGSAAHYLSGLGQVIALLCSSVG